ncbi:MAG: hypothetical protein IJW08_10165, partial [Lentisphaeria bacterium]|nr:hypothetical protein [Lentisphaeria bacterium]
AKRPITIGGCSVSQGKCFAYEQLRECTTVHDRSSAVARHEIVRNAPPPVVFLLYASDCT